MIYFTSDFHFGHKKLITFERTKFPTIEEHNNKIIRIWEKTIKSEDTVYFLGDFGFLNDEQAQIFKNLPGKKIILLGNHDNLSELEYREKYGFEEVYKNPIYLSKRIILSHEPVVCGKDVINVHGHLHNAKLSLPNAINVNVDVQEYILFSMKRVHSTLGQLPKESTKFLKEWYAEYVQFGPKFVFFDPEDEKKVNQRSLNGSSMKNEWK